MRGIAVAVVMVALSLMLSACGESDLEDIQDRELDEAIARLNATDGGGTKGGDTTATPDNNGGQGNQGQGSGSGSGVDLSQYDLVFSDEFNGDSIDGEKWNTALSWGPDFVVYNQLQYYVDTQNDAEFGYNPFSFDGESLTISAIQTPDTLRSAANEQPWLSGVLTSAEKLELTYGYIEARVKMDQGKGLWPAFWMLSAGLEGLRPELFIMEYDGSVPDSFFHNYNYLDDNGDLRSPGQHRSERDGLSGGFHTVGVNWTEEELLFYINGTPTYRIIGASIPQQDMYLILNLAMGGIWPGTPDAATPDPATFTIDYVRVYQPKP